MSCTHIVFDVPQPRDGTALATFPDEFRGIYVFKDEPIDSLIVERTTVTFVEHSMYEIPLRSLDTLLHITLKDGLLYDARLMRAEGVPYQVEDSLIKYAYSDRYVTGISDTLILKRSGKYLVANSNFKDDDVDYWDVVLVEKQKSGHLVISTVRSLKLPGEENQSGTEKKELSYYGKIAPYEKLSERTYLFKPTSRQFLKLIKRHLFEEEQEYKQVR